VKRDGPDDVGLAWKWRQGGTYDFEFRQKSLVKSQPERQGGSTTLDQTADLTWTVASVDADGTAVLSQKIQAIRVMVDSGTFKSSYDSRKSDATQPSGRAFAEVYNAAMATKITLRVDRRGRILQVQIPESLAKTLAKSALQAMAQSLSLVSEPGLRTLFGLHVPPLPETTLNVGEARERVIEVPADPVTLELHLRDHLKSDTETTTTFEVRGSIKASPGTRQGLSIQVRESKIEGELVFDKSKGQLSESRMTQRLTVALIFEGKESRQAVDVESSLKSKLRVDPQPGGSR
jgi:hypothetical protein